MAAITVTAANVRPTNTTNYVREQVGETVTAGQSVYKKASDSKWYKADSNNTAETAGSAGIGVVLTNAGTDEYAFVATGGIYVAGATVVTGTLYIIGTTAGDINPATDQAAGWYGSFLGIASSTANINLRPWASGYLRP